MLQAPHMAVQSGHKSLNAHDNKYRNRYTEMICAHDATLIITWARRRQMADRCGPGTVL